MQKFINSLLSFVRIWTLKSLVGALMILWRRADPPPAHCAPTMIRAYPVRPKLRNRVFIPETYAPHQKPLPLYLNIHGGGWTVMDAVDDDEFCSYIANTFGVVVVNIDYHKAPRNQFPGPVDDVVNIAVAAIGDPSLPVDRSRIALGGFSAGANLALAASQKPELEGCVQAVVCFFGSLDMATPVSQKLVTRFCPDRPDMLAKLLPIFNDAYIPPGTDLTDPILSPFYAERNSLPPWLCVIGAEEDCLCLENQSFAQKMAGAPTNGQSVEHDSWTIGKVKWELMRGMTHNFTHLKKRDRSQEKQRLAANTSLYARIFRWLETGPWL